MAASETEVERLVVRFVGDLSDLSAAEEEVSDVIKKATEVQEELHAAIDNVYKITEEINSQSKVTVDSQSDINKVTLDAANSQEDAAKKMEEAKNALDDLEGAIHKADASIVEMVETTGDYVAGIEGMTGSGMEAIDAYSELEKVVGLVNSRFFESTEEVGGLEAALRQAAVEEDALLESIQNTTSGLEDFGSVIDSAQQEQAKFEEENKKSTESIKGMNVTLDGLLGGLQALPGPAGAVATQFKAMAASIGATMTAIAPLLPVIIAAGAALTVIAGPILLVRKLVRDSIRDFGEYDRVIKKATALGESTENLQKLSFALMEIAGMEAGSTEMSLQRLQMRIGAAAAQGEEGRKKFAELGIDLEALKNKTPTEQFKEVAGALGAIENDSKRAQLAMQMFGRQGLNIVGALKADAEVIRESEETALRLGITLTEEQSRAIEGAGDSLTRVQTISKGWAMQIAAELAPAVWMVADAIQSWQVPAGEMKGIIRDMTTQLVSLAGIAHDIGMIIEGTWKFSTGNFEEGINQIRSGLAGDSREASKVMLELYRSRAKAAAEEAAKIDEANTLEAERLAKQEQLNDSAEQYVQSLKTQYEFMQQMETGEKSQKIFELKAQGVDPDIIDAARQFEEGIAEIQAKQEAAAKRKVELEKEANDALREREKLMARGKAIAESMLTDEERIFKQAQELSELFIEGAISEDVYNQALEKLSEDLDGLTQQARGFWDALNGTSDEWGRGREGIKDLAKDFRAAQMVELSKEHDIVPMGMSAMRHKVDMELKNQNDPVQRKLVSVLTLLEERLREPPNPDRPNFDLIESLQG